MSVITSCLGLFSPFIGLEDAARKPLLSTNIKSNMSLGTSLSMSVSHPVKFPQQVFQDSSESFLSVDYRVCNDAKQVSARFST